MRRIIALIASLYPGSWRERYGEEFAALLEDVDPSARTVLNVLTGALVMRVRTWNLGVAFAISATVAAAAFAAECYFVPVSYVSRGFLKLEGTGKFTQADLDSINTAAQVVESRRVITAILTSRNLYPSERARMYPEDVLDLMRRKIKVEPVGLAGGGKGFLVDFAYRDPKLAQMASQDLMDAFLKNSSAPLQVLESATLPDKPTRSLWLLAYAALLPGALALAVLLLLRRRALRKA